MAHTFEVSIRFVHRAPGARWPDGVLRTQAQRQNAYNLCSTNEIKAYSAYFEDSGYRVVYTETRACHSVFERTGPDETRTSDL